MGDVSWEYYEGTLKERDDWREVGKLLQEHPDVLGWHYVRACGPHIRFRCNPGHEGAIAALLEEYTVDGFSRWDYSPLGQLYESIPAVTILEILEANSLTSLEIPHLEDMAGLHFLANWHHWLARQFQGGFTDEEMAITQAHGLIRNYENMVQHPHLFKTFLQWHTPQIIEALNGVLDRVKEVEDGDNG